MNLVTNVANFFTSHQKFGQAGRSFLLVSAAAICLTSCGGGGGDDGEENVVAPQSLEGVTMRLFNSFDLDFVRGAGTRDNESGAFVFTRRAQNFRLAIPAGTSNLGFTVELPVALTTSRYTYLRTGVDTGRVTLTFGNAQVYPWPLATAASPTPVGGQADMFWGGRLGLATNLILDVLFVDNNGFLTVNTTRVRSAYIYQSSFEGMGPATSTASPIEFDTIDAQISLFTARLPTGYDPYDSIDSNTPTRIVWPALTTRTVDFDGSDLARRVAFRFVTGAGPSIPGVERPEESGTLLVDDANGALGAQGTFSYARTGGNLAKLVINYSTPVVPPTVPPTTVPSSVVYTMTFVGLDGGTFVDSNGATGTFSQDPTTNL
jgi:hypothetical protein